MAYKKHIIVGWGIAGSTMAWHLWRRNQPFEVYDNGKNHATRIAAGMINPIGFRRLTKSWNADRLIPYCQRFYKEIATQLSADFFEQRDIFRVFASVEEANDWSVREGDDRFGNYMDTPPASDRPNENEVDYPFGLGRVNGMSHLDTVAFLDLSMAYFQKQGVVFHEKEFDYESMVAHQAYVFCEGTGVWGNPIFNDLPLNGTHGETLDIEAKDFDFKHVLNKRLYLKPTGDKAYRVGATYNWKLKEPVTTKEGKAELLDRIAAFTNFEFKVLRHQGGIRPTVKDRRPLIGQDEHVSNAYIFNGLGTKGVMVAPYYANQLCDLILHSHEVDAEVDIKRFRKN
jgi:glycine/D-amino acid oxidase-like deaminating enzyme